MTMLIKGAHIHTMTARGSFVGDILIRGEKIQKVAETIEVPEAEPACQLDAKGMTVLPGLIDMHICDGPETQICVLETDDCSGVTTGLLWPEEEGNCRLLYNGQASGCRIFHLPPEKYTDHQLHERFITLANEGLTPACLVRDSKQCARVLQTVYSSRVRAILLHISGCEEMLEAISLSGCPVIIGVGFGSNPWTVAKQLDALGTQVALTCSYPASRLRHLPLCAAFCARDGMEKERALAAITRAPAALLGLPEAGRIEAGARADLCIYDGNPFLLATSHVMTISAGKIRH